MMTVNEKCTYSLKYIEKNSRKTATIVPNLPKALRACSECKTAVDPWYQFCPKCGAEFLNTCSY